MSSARGQHDVARRPPGLALLTALAFAIATAPGCVALGRATNDAYTWSSATFTPNPASVLPRFLGFGLGFIAGLPLCLVSWPLTALGYPPDDAGEFSLSASVAPGVWLGCALGDVLALPFYPFGLPFEPDDAVPPG